MSNVELTKYYLGMQQKTEKMPEVACSNIIPALDQHFNGQWTWELADEKFAMDNTVVCTTVTVYTPGKIYTGRAFNKIKDYHVNHLHAIVDACKSFTNTVSGQSSQAPQSINPSNLQMTPDQIMAAVGQTQPQPQQVDTAAQFYNYTDAQGNPSTEVPFDAMTDRCHQELQQEMGMINPNQPVPQPIPQQPQQNMADYDTPQERLKGFTQRQIDRLNQFKKDFDILNDEMFGNYVNTWDKSLTSKKDIVPSNVESFLAWAENLGKTGC